MRLRIYTDDDPVLRGPSAPVKQVTDEIKLLAFEMLKTMAHSNGMGLAAPQIGVKLQIIVFDTTFDADSGLLRMMINPRVVSSSEACNTTLEGCLSFPGRQIKVKRPNKARIEYLNIRGQKVVEDFEGLNARVALHEIDHLSGILLIDNEKQ